MVEGIFMIPFPFSNGLLIIHYIDFHASLSRQNGKNLHLTTIKETLLITSYRSIVGNSVAILIFFYLQ